MRVTSPTFRRRGCFSPQPSPPSFPWKLCCLPCLVLSLASASCTSSSPSFCLLLLISLPPSPSSFPTLQFRPRYQMLFLHPTVPIPNVAPNPTSRRSSITITSQSQALLHAHVSDRSKKQHPFPTPLHEREWLNSRPSRCREGDGDVKYFLKKKTSEVGPRPRWTLTSFGDDNCMCAVSGDTSADELRMRAYWGMSAGQTQEQVTADASHPSS